MKGNAQAMRVAIEQVVRGIAPGSVLSYGEVARRAGWPRRARLVARILATADDPQLPWHRVVRSDGRIAFGVGSPAFLRQQQLLGEEGVTVVNGRVRAASRTLDAMLWG